jgi:DNA helicase-2/ATP-dependent DNA helicase PcrA
VCGRTLSEAGEIKLMRCEGCPSDLDEGLYERLRDWRTAQAKRLGQPAYCVFTDKTLLAIAENVPGDEAALSRVAGVGARKLERFGADVLALCAGVLDGIPDSGESPDAAPDRARDAAPGAAPDAVPHEVTNG